MNHPKIFIYWLPRIISIGYVMFISIFAMDVFSEYSGLGVLLPLFMHLLPSIFLLIVIAIAWRYEVVGAIFFVGFAMFYVWSVGFSRPVSWYFGVALPSSIVGILYFLSWIRRRK